MNEPLDLRHLPAPEPMERIVTALEALAPGAVLVALTPFRPLPLLPLLEDWGFCWKIEELPDGHARIAIWRRDDAARLDASA